MKLERSVIVNSLVLALALGSGVAVLVTRKFATTDEQSARKNNLCAELPREDVKRLRLREGANAFVLVRKAAVDGGAPEFELEGQGPADAEAAESLLRALEVASFDRRFDDKEVDLHAFGLDTPRAELHLELAASELEIEVGKAAATGAESYVRTRSRSHGVTVGLVKNATLKDLFPSADDLRPRTILPLAVSELREVAFKDAGHDVHVHRGKGPSFLDANNRRVARDAVERLGYELFGLKAERFVSLPEANAALDAGGSLDASFTRNDGVSFAARFGGTCPGAPDLSVFVRSKPTALAACITPGARQLFWNTANNLENEQTFDLHVDEVESVRIEQGDKKLELVRNERGFSLRAPSVATVALDAGNDRIRALIAEGTRVLEPDSSALGLGFPGGKVTLHSTSLHEPPSFDEVLELGRVQRDGRLPVRRAEDGVVLLLSRDVARAFQVDSTLLRARELFDFGASDFVELDVSFGREREKLRRSPAGVFELASPPAPHDATLSLELVQALGALSVQRWVADDDDGSFGLESPRVRAELTLTPNDGGARHFTLLIGKDTAGGAYAKLAERAGVFVLERDIVTQLTTLLLTRAAFASDPNSVERVELEHRGNRRVLTRSGGALRVVEGSTLPPDVIATISEVLANLRPEAALHSGAATADEGFEKPLLRAKVVTRAGLGVDKTFRIGAGDVYRDTPVYYARVDGIDATYVIAKSALRPLLDAL
ncbi:MAG TPA: DUF4340 domain-containing protein [Polyangiaceae bacterium]|nr:DUF4340 domain-containing protein [Polyangiaceae bacterium]